MLFAVVNNKKKPKQKTTVAANVQSLMEITNGNVSGRCSQGDNKEIYYMRNNNKKKTKFTRPSQITFIDWEAAAGHNKK